MVTPLKYYVFENIMEDGAFAPLFENIMENEAFAPTFENMENGAFARGANATFSIIFSKVFKVYLIFT